MNGYLLDSDIWIISNRHYRQRFFPIVWHFFLNTEHLYMLDRVYEEITTKDDELSVWSKSTLRVKPSCQIYLLPNTKLLHST